MKVGTLIIMTGAILALSASAASANLDRILPVKQTFAVHHKGVTHKKVVKHKVAKKQSTGPRYIHLPGPTTPPVPYVGDCISSGNNCTDQQLCDIWGMNCDLVETSTPSVAAPAAPTPDAGSAGTAPATDSAPANSVASDDNSMVCPSGTMWDAEYQYCN
jgi:hypothetical protein